MTDSQTPSGRCGCDRCSECWLRMATDALAKSNMALLALKAWIKDDEEWTPEQRRKLVQIVNDGYDHGVATLSALPRNLGTPAMTQPLPRKINSTGGRPEHYHRRDESEVPHMGQLLPDRDDWPYPAAVPMPNEELEQLRIRWEVDEPRWHYVLETFWHLDYPQMVEKLALFKTLDEAVEQADRERGGMIAT